MASGTTQPTTNTNMSDRAWDRLVADIEAKECTPFLGPELVSDKSLLPGAIAARWAADYSLPHACGHSLPRVAESLAAINEDWKTPKREISKLFSQGPLSKPELDQLPHFHLANLPFPVYISTYYDDLIVQALKNQGYRKPRAEVCHWSWASRDAKTNLDDFEPSLQEPAVFQLFGTASRIESLVLYEGEYLKFLARVSSDPKIIPPAIAAALKRSNSLFLGYRAFDLDFLVLLQLLSTQIERDKDRRGTPHVAVLCLDVENSEREITETFLDNYFADLRITVGYGTVDGFIEDLMSRIS